MKPVKIIAVLAVLIASTLLMTSCGQIKEFDVSQVVNTAQIVRPVQIIAESTPTPEPVVVARDPVKRHSPMRIQTDVPSGYEVPSFYFPVDLDGVNHVVYAYVNNKGKYVYRVFAEVDEEEDGNVIQTYKGFYNANITQNKNGAFTIETNKDDMPIDTSTEKPAKYIPSLLPTKTNIKTYIRDAANAKKKYEKAVSNAQKKGEPVPEPTPWDGTPILTQETTAITLPTGVKASKKGFSMYYYINVYGEYEFRRYATCDGETGNFYYVNEDGKIAPGSLPVDISRDFDKSNFKGRKALDKPDFLVYRLPVLIELSNGQVITVYTVFEK